MRISYTAGRQKGLRKSVYDWGVISFLIPTWDLVKTYRTGQVERDEYVRRYLDLLQQRWDVVDEWLHSLESEENLTLLCHEREGELCHRRLIAKLLAEHRPDIDVVLRLAESFGWPLPTVGGYALSDIARRLASSYSR